MKVITINNWKRPNMYKRVLEGLEKNPEIGEYKIINICDFHPNRMLKRQFHKLDDEFRSVMDIETHSFDENMGCAEAKKIAFTRGFETGAEFVINLEDDIVPGRSFLHYMEAMQNKFKGHPDVHSILGWSRTVRESTGDFSRVFLRTPDRTYQAFGIWDYIWEETGCGADWFGIHWNEKVYKPKDGMGHEYTGEEFIKRILKNPKGSWGWPFLNYWRRGRRCVIPAVSRCQNIGDTEGTFNYNPEWHRTWIHNTVWADDRTAPTTYEIIEKP